MSNTFFQGGEKISRGFCPLVMELATSRENEMKSGCKR